MFLEPNFQSRADILDQKQNMELIQQNLNFIQIEYFPDVQYSAST